MKVITVASLKGGVGKTTMVAHLANAIAAKGKAVMVCDFDPNNNLTDYFCRDVSDADVEARNAYHFLTGRKGVGGCLHDTKLSPRIAVMPSTVALHNTAIECGTNPVNMMSVRDQLRAFKGYDYCIIDTAPSRDYCTQTGLFAANEIIIPINYSRWSVQAVVMLLDDVKRISHYGKGKAIINVVPSAVTTGENDKMREAKTFAYDKSTIFKSASIRSAVDRGVILTPHGEPAKMFDKLAKVVAR